MLDVPNAIELVPPWIDAGLSANLPQLCGRGEGQHLEFMIRFPEQAHELAKEIAAFATSNEGTILLGVQDDGALVGVPDLDSAEARDHLVRRIEGVCSRAVTPSVTPMVKFGSASGRIVVAIVVSKGREPVYYSTGRPYLRYVTSSRLATPDEVVELVRAHLASSAPRDQEANDASKFLSSLAAVLVDLGVFLAEIDERSVSPWLDGWRHRFGGAASDLRDLATSEAAASNGAAGELRSLADALDEAAHLRLYIGCATELDRLVQNVRELVARLRTERFAQVPIAPATVRAARTEISRLSRVLDELSQRADTMVRSGRLDDLQSEASQVGYGIARIGHFEIPDLGVETNAVLRETGRTLHLVETRTIYADGGRSMQEVVDAIRASAERLRGVATTIAAPTIIVPA